ncbi:MAG: hypothetical protein ACRETT_03170 [Steroidobacteraceae bacterium]
MRYALAIAASALAAFAASQPAAADHNKPWVRLQIGIPIERILGDGVIFVSGGERYWVPDGYRDYRECRDRRHRRHRHVHVYYDPGTWREDDWREERWNDEDSDSDADSDSDRRKHRRVRHYRSYRDYGHRQANGTLVLTIPID